jgi:hypothetical protein
MYEFKKAESIEEKQLVIAAMRGVGKVNAEYVWGFWDRGTCIGGTNLYNLNDITSKDNYAVAISVKPDFSSALLWYKAIVAALEVKSRIVAKVALTNKESRKGARQLGFRPIYVEDGYEYLEISKLPEKMHARWGKYV